MLINQGEILEAKYKWSGKIQDLRWAIGVTSLAMETMEGDYPGRPTCFASLGSKLGLLYERTGNIADIERAIQLGQIAVAGMPDNHPYHSTCSERLKANLSRRYQRTGELHPLLRERVDSSTSIVSLADINSVASKNIYSALETGHIRIVNLHRGERGDPIRCSFIQVSLSEAPAFEALSYVWGPESDSCRILVNSLPFHITRNLYHALFQLRSQVEDRLIWIDALAINQSDTIERNYQVRTMHMIYRNAALVLVWLGRDDPEVDPMFDGIAIGEAKGFGAFWEQAFGTDAFEKALSATVRLYNIEYWSRVWVLQEIAYAGDILLILGQKSASYQSLLAFTRFILDKPYKNNNHFEASIEIRLSGPNALPEPGSARMMRYVTAQEWQKLVTVKKCHDPRDLVFGFYGCFVSELRDRISIDYGREVGDIFRLMTQAIVETTHDLSVIFQAKPSGLGLERPSWSPDYREKPIPIAFSNANFRPSAPADRVYEFMDDGKILRVKGVCIGTIQARTAVYRSDARMHQNVSQLDGLGFARHMIASCEDLEMVSDDATVVAFADVCQPFVSFQDMEFVTRLLTYDAHLDGKSNDAKAYELYMREHLALDCSSAFHDGRVMFSFIPAVADVISSAYEQLTVAPYVGAGSELIAVGDKVCVILGCSAPVILRSLGEQHTFLGDTYIHGYNEAEAVKQVEGDLDQLRDFFLI
jgi:hypothetical protein